MEAAWSVQEAVHVLPEVVVELENFQRSTEVPLEAMQAVAEVPWVENGELEVVTTLRNTLDTEATIIMRWAAPTIRAMTT